MRLKTKLVVGAAGAALLLVAVVSGLFLGELLRERVGQTAASNEVMARQLVTMVQAAVREGLTSDPPANGSELALREAVVRALQGSDALRASMDGFVRYSPGVEDVRVTDAGGQTLVSAGPPVGGGGRLSFARVRDGSVWYQEGVVFGKARVFDVAAVLNRNGEPFLAVHVGVRSSFLRNNYKPWLEDAGFIALVAGVIAMLLAAALASVALRPVEEIGRRLEGLALAPVEGPDGPAARGRGTDAVVRAEATIDRLGEQMRTVEAGYSEVRERLDSVLDTLRDGVVLFTAERRAAMVSEAVENFVGSQGRTLVGLGVEELFGERTALAEAVLRALAQEGRSINERVRLEDGREVELTVDRVDDRRGRMGTMVTLRDAGSAMRLGQELEVSRRLAAVGRLTAGVGHEVKNPINAMVVHLELLRGKLEDAGRGRSFLGGAMRHVEILAGEMARLDRVVETLADFTRPMELHLKEVDLREVVESVAELTGAEMEANGVRVECGLGEAVLVRADEELLRRAVLNLMLNGMQAMTGGGVLRVRVGRAGDEGVVEVADEGEGIAAEVLPKIFELYFSTKAKGSGIGLAMTYRIAQMHGGGVEVASDAGQGAVFTLRLPVLGEMGRTGRAERVR